MVGKPGRSLLLPGVPVISPGDRVTRWGSLQGVQGCGIKAAPCRSAGTPPSGSHPPRPVVGWAQGCAGADGASQIHLGGGILTGLGNWGEPGIKSHHDPAPVTQEPSELEAALSPRTHHHGSPENVTPRSPVPCCHQTRRWPSISAWLPCVPLPSLETHPSAPTCVQFPPARMDEESRG